MKSNEVAIHLKRLNTRWLVDTKAQLISLTHTLTSYQNGLELVQTIGLLAEKSRHHPELNLSFKTLTVRLWTHDVQGLTEKDFDLAVEIDVILDKNAH